jgi:hypothetical protein
MRCVVGNEGRKNGGRAELSQSADLSRDPVSHSISHLSRSRSAPCLTNQIFGTDPLSEHVLPSLAGVKV